MSLEIDGFDTDCALYTPTSSPFLSDTDAKVMIVTNRIKKEGEIGVNATWGDGKGITYEFFGKGTAQDNRGNKAEFTAKQKSDGTGNFSAFAKKEFLNKPKD